MSDKELSKRLRELYDLAIEIEDIGAGLKVVHLMIDLGPQYCSEGDKNEK